MTGGGSSILICGFSPKQAVLLHQRLEAHYSILLADTFEEVHDILNSQEVDLAICQHETESFDALRLLHDMRISNPDTIRVLAGSITDDESGRAIHEAAIYQFLPSQAPLDQVELLVRRALENRELSYRHRHLSRELKIAEDVLQKYKNKISDDLDEGYRFEKLVYSNPDMAALCSMAKKAAVTMLPILIQGETGTGKELLASAIHLHSDRKDQPLLVHNCGGMSDELLHSELFGHKRGSFTGAVSDRLGLLPAADGGTVFLDEIADVSPKFQVSLLRFLQEGEIKPLGSDEIKYCDVRVIAACNQDLEKMVEEGQFRQDLYYRLNGFELRIPPLRQRLDDIQVLANFLINKFASTLGKRVLGATPDVIEKFQHYEWPGNVRELENELKRMMALTDNGSYISTEQLSPNIRDVKVKPQSYGGVALDLAGGSLKEKVEEIEVRIISEALLQNRWNQSKTASALGLSRVGLSNKIKRYGLADELVIS